MRPSVVKRRRPDAPCLPLYPASAVLPACLMTSEPDDPPSAVEAATVVLLRDRAGEVEVLMLRKNSTIHFGGMWVFPGGRVDPEDREGADDELAAFRRAAVREAAEEAGVELDAPSLVHLSHWLPPPARRVRFSTHFFVTALRGDGQSIAIDGGEIVDHAWISAEQALSRRAAGEIELVTPTFVTLAWLTRFDTADAALGAIDTVQSFHTRSIETDAGRIALYHGDAGYESGDLGAAGPRRRANMLDSGWWWEEHDGISD